MERLLVLDRHRGETFRLSRRFRSREESALPGNEILMQQLTGIADTATV